jgi:acetylornithine aminotransferase
MSHIMNTYNPLPVAFARGEGCWLWDTNGKRYLDALAGIAVSGLGHAHPKLVKAISEQAGKLIHTSNLVQVPEQEALADKLCELSGMDNVFFCNSGAEANECAIKLARFTATRKALPTRPSSLWKRRGMAAPWQPSQLRPHVRRRRVSSRW